MTTPGGPGLAGLSVSRETIDLLHDLEARARHWNAKINLFSRSTTDDIWARHIVDSAQIVLHLDEWPRTWADLGSGGGFPALVVAAIATELSPETHVTMIESDQRKCAFLRQTSQALGLAATVIARRIEEASPQGAHVVSARALAPLDRLLPLVHRHLDPEGTALLMKGQRWEDELRALCDDWRFQLDVHRSITHPDAAILAVKDLTRG